MKKLCFILIILFGSTFCRKSAEEEDLVQEIKTRKFKVNVGIMPEMKLSAEASPKSSPKASPKSSPKSSPKLHANLAALETDTTYKLRAKHIEFEKEGNDLIFTVETLKFKLDNDSLSDYIELSDGDLFGGDFNINLTSENFTSSSIILWINQPVAPDVTDTNRDIISLSTSISNSASTAFNINCVSTVSFYMTLQSFIDTQNTPLDALAALKDGKHILNENVMTTLNQSLVKLVTNKDTADTLTDSVILASSRIFNTLNNVAKNIGNKVREIEETDKVYDMVDGLMGALENEILTNPSLQSSIQQHLSTINNEPEVFKNSLELANEELNKTTFETIALDLAVDEDALAYFQTAISKETTYFDEVTSTDSATDISTDTTPPDKVTGLAHISVWNQSTGTPTITWSESDALDIHYYIAVVWLESNNTTTRIIDGKIYAGDPTKIEFPTITVQDGSYYYVTVQAVDKAGNVSETTESNGWRVTLN